MAIRFPTRSNSSTAQPVHSQDDAVAARSNTSPIDVNAPIGYSVPHKTAGRNKMLAYVLLAGLGIMGLLFAISLSGTVPALSTYFATYLGMGEPATDAVTAKPPVTPPVMKTANTSSPVASHPAAPVTPASAPLPSPEAQVAAALQAAQANQPPPTNTVASVTPAVTAAESSAPQANQSNQANQALTSSPAQPVASEQPVSVPSPDGQTERNRPSSSDKPTVSYNEFIKAAEQPVFADR